MLFGTSVYRACSIEINAELKQPAIAWRQPDTAAIFH